MLSNSLLQQQMPNKISDKEPTLSSVAEAWVEWEKDYYDVELFSRNASAQELLDCLNLNNPTLLVDAGRSAELCPSLASSHQIARINSELIEQGKSKLNIIIAKTDNSLTRMEDGTYVLSSGIVVNSRGEILYGDFEQPITVDILACDDDKHIDNYHTLKRVNGIEGSLLTWDKSKQKVIMNELGITTAPSFRMEQDPPGDIPQALREKGFNFFDTLVVKPVDGCCGEDISFIQSFELSNNWRKDFLCEKRVDSFDLFDEQHQKIDWNLRVLICNGNVLGAFVRYSATEGPVNIATGAKILRWDESCFEQFGMDHQLNSLIVGAVNKELKVIASKLKVLDLGICGIDIIVDNSLKSNLLEINGIRSGGIRHLVSLNPEDAHRLILDFTSSIQQMVNQIVL